MTTFEERLKEKFNEKFTFGGVTGTVVFKEARPYDVWQFLQDALREQKLEIKGKVKKMGKRRLDSPRSFGDGDVVDVAPGYNQAIEDILTLLEGDENEKKI